MKRARSPTLPDDDDDPYGLNAYVPTKRRVSPPAPPPQPADEEEDEFGLDRYIPQASTSVGPATPAEKSVPPAIVDDRVLDRTTSTAKKLASDVFANETAEARAAREAKLAAQQAIDNERASALAKFYCALCERQSPNVRLHEEHLNSYLHHHNKRSVEEKAARIAAKHMSGEAERVREKERQREERELARLGRAHGVASDTIATSLAPIAPPAVTSSNTGPIRIGFKRLNSFSREPAPPASQPEPVPASSRSPTRPRAAAFFDDEESAPPALPLGGIAPIAVGKRHLKARPPPGAMMGGDAQAEKPTTAAQAAMGANDEDDGLLAAAAAAKVPAGRFKSSLGSGTVGPGRPR